MEESLEFRMKQRLALRVEAEYIGHQGHRFVQAKYTQFRVHQHLGIPISKDQARRTMFNDHQRQGKHYRWLRKSFGALHASL